MPASGTRRSEIAVVYLAGLVQGLALVTVPAASSVLTSPDEFGLSSSAYGSLFLPQAITAVIGSLLGGHLAGRIGARRVLLWGLALDLLAMCLLVASPVGMGSPLGYAMLLAATASLGAGFGLTVPTLNLYAGAFFPERVDRAVLILNALLGLGTALAPLLAALFLAIDLWWGLPALVALALLGVLGASLRLPLEGGASVSGAPNAAAVSAAPRRSLSPRAWLFITIALLYGIVETVNGNWATVYMANDLDASPSAASLALAAFWAMVTVGRLAFAAAERRLPQTRTYRVLPFVVAFALAGLAILPAGSVGLGILAFGLAGLGCSALLPLTISFGERELVALGAATASIIFAAYQVGYGVAAFGVGPLEEVGLPLSAIYAAAAGVAVVLALLSRRLVSGRAEAPAA